MFLLNILLQTVNILHKYLCKIAFCGTLLHACIFAQYTYANCMQWKFISLHDIVDDVLICVQTMFALQMRNDNTSYKCSTLKNILTTTKSVFEY